MNIIEWLLQTTSKGATYLQVIIILTITICVLVAAIFINYREGIKKNENKENL